MKCDKCGYHDVVAWSKQQDMNMKEGLAYAVVGTIFNGLGHFVLGNSRYNKSADLWNQEVFYCRHCGAYFMRCPECKTLIPVRDMPEDGKTIARCGSCRKTVLYASDYDMGGG